MLSHALSPPIPHSTMATNLQLLPIHGFPLSSWKCPKHPQRVPVFSLQPLSPPPSPKSILSSRRRASVAHAVKEEVIQSPNSDPALDSKTSPPASSKLVLVAGGSGGVGQLIVASLLDRNIKSRLLLRDPEKATSLFGKQDEETLQVYKGDTRNPEDLDSSIFEGVTHVICCTGTTAFPSKRWDGDNTPEKVDWEGIRNLVSALPSSLKRIVLVSSVGVTKFNELPWSIMNLFGVLKYKKMGEDFLCSSGLPFTIIRAGRLTDGPYTSYDLNTLLKATAGQRRAVLMGQGDKLVGEVSRIVVAEACIQALDMEFTEGKIYEINSVEVHCKTKMESFEMGFSSSWNDDSNSLKRWQRIDASIAMVNKMNSFKTALEWRDFSVECIPSLPWRWSRK